jgi:hypothetical protein
MSASFGTVVGVSNIGSFVIEAIGLGHLLASTAKRPAAIIEKARDELCAAFEIIDKFHVVMDNDLLTPLVEKYER